MQQSAGRVRNGGQRPVWQGPDGCGTGDRDTFGVLLRIFAFLGRPGNIRKYAVIGGIFRKSPDIFGNIREYK